MPETCTVTNVILTQFNFALIYESMNTMAVWDSSNTSQTEGLCVFQSIAPTPSPSIIVSKAVKMDGFLS